MCWREGRAGVEYSQVECLRGRIDDTNRVHTLCTHLFEFKFLATMNGIEINNGTELFVVVVVVK